MRRSSSRLDISGILSLGRLTIVRATLAGERERAEHVLHWIQLFAEGALLKPATLCSPPPCHGTTKRTVDWTESFFFHPRVLSVPVFFFLEGLQPCGRLASSA